MIRVGGAAGIEVRERKDGVDDANPRDRGRWQKAFCRAVGCAASCGQGAREAERRKRGSAPRDGMEEGLVWPARQIAINAGEDGSLVIGKILDRETYA